MKPLRYWRNARGFSLADLSRRTGCSRSAISQYERGVNTPPIPVCLTLAQALGIDPNVLLQDFHGVSLADTPRGVRGP